MLKCLAQVFCPLQYTYSRARIRPRTHSQKRKSKRKNVFVLFVLWNGKKALIWWHAILVTTGSISKLFRNLQFVYVTVLSKHQFYLINLVHRLKLGPRIRLNLGLGLSLSPKLRPKVKPKLKPKPGPVYLILLDKFVSPIILFIHN